MTDSNFSIRNFQEADYQQLLKIWDELGLGNAQRGDNLQVIKSTIQNGGQLFVIDDSCGHLIATAWITNDHRRLYLHHFGVKLSYQNRGIGKKLALHCIQWAKTKGLQLKLEVHQENKKALKLYKGAGFKLLGDYNVYIIRNFDIT